MDSKNNTSSNNNNIRKYLVLLHDCLAIKFIPLQPPPVPVATPTSTSTRPTARNSQNKSSASTIQSPRRTTATAPVRGGHDHYENDEDEEDYDYEEDYENKGKLSKSCINKRKQVGIGESSYLTSTSTSSRQVDQSLKGLLLYKEFRDMNLLCFWNAALQESFEKLEYKGTVVPSTILVGSPIRRHLTILKTAFSRKMLKCPEGFRIEFVGEIEELIADPIEKSHFIPLSDSLCWAIHELTSAGQEAFVDEILMELSSAFPETVLPPKELIYQVLERLTKERKVYQTSQGYFVVTPETHRYIVNTDPTMMFIYPRCPQGTDTANASNGYHRLRGGGGFNESFKGRAGTLDSLKSRPPVIPEIPDDDLNEFDLQSQSIIDHYEEVQPAHMKRCNSLRNSMKRNEKVSGCLPRRTFSMRSSKIRAKDNCPNSSGNSVNLKASRMSLKDSVLSLDVYGVSVNDETVKRREKHKSFLKKLLTFRRSRRGIKKEKNNAENLDQITIDNHNDDSIISEKTFETVKSTKTMLTMSTQTSNSVEHLPSSFGLLSIANPNCNSSSAKSPELLDSDSGRYTESSASSASPQSEVDIEISNVTNSDMMRSNTPQDHQEQLGSDLHFDKDPRHVQSFESCTSSPSPSYRSGCDTISNSKWNPTTLSPNLQSRSNSSASSSISSYRELYNKYRRKHPSYHQQYNPNHSPNPRQCQQTLVGSSGSVTPPPSSSSLKPQSPFKYPPRQFEKKQIYKEMSHRSSQNKVDLDLDGPTTTITKTNTNNDNKKVQGTSSTSSMTTIVTQTLKNSTNLELELLFPLGKLISAALTDFEQKSEPKEPIKKHNHSNGDDTCILINNNENKQVPENSKNVSSTITTTTTSTSTSTANCSNTNCTNNPNTNRNSKQKADSEGVISEVSTTTVNDLFTINCKSFIKTNLNNDGLTSTMEFKTKDTNTLPTTSKTNSYININTTSKINNSKPKGNSYVPEPVSYKPFRFTNFESRECRESEII